MKHSTLVFSVVALSVALAGCATSASKPAAATPPVAASSAPTTPATPATPAVAPTTAAAPEAAPQQGAPVSVFLAQKQRAPGMTALKLEDTTLWYAPQPILTRADMVRATPLKTKDGRNAILFNFSAEGAKKLADVTGKANRGRFLVVTVGHNLVAIPQIDAELSSGALGFVVASPEQSQAIMNALEGSTQK